MSHLAHTVALKQAMIAANITCLETQTDVIEAAYVEALAKYLFNNSLVFAAYTEEVDETLLNRLSRWNEISPINGGKIINLVRGIFPALTNQGMNHLNFKPYPGLEVDGYDYRNCPLFNNLADWLFNEMVNNND